MDPTISFPACALCGAQRKLEQSHIIPQFVYRWAKQTGHDGEPATTRPMLCGGCEDLFSAHESEFARHVFHPAVAGALLSAKYGGWLRKFAASVCWRVLEERILTEGLAELTPRWTTEVTSCRTTWKAYLNGKRPDVGGHHLHLVPAGREEAWTVAGAVSCTEHEAFVCVRLGPFNLLGLIADSEPRQWLGTRLNAEGKLKPRAVSIPAAYHAYLFARPRQTVAAKSG